MRTETAALLSPLNTLDHGFYRLILRTKGLARCYAAGKEYQADVVGVPDVSFGHVCCS